MNFLGHCYLCEKHTHLIAGNLAGDFYKGNLDKFSNLPKNILDGLRLHRFIDDVTDQSALIIKAAHIFRADGISRVAFIACDILLDHYLAKNWSTFSATAYEDFIQLIYSNVENDLKHLDSGFHYLFDRMKEYGWMLGYPTEAGIGQALSQFSRRIPFENDLHKSLAVYQKHQSELEDLFKTFLVEIKDRSGDFIDSRNAKIS